MTMSGCCRMKFRDAATWRQFMQRGERQSVGVQLSTICRRELKRLLPLSLREVVVVINAGETVRRRQWMAERMDQAGRINIVCVRVCVPACCILHPDHAQLRARECAL